MLAVYLTGSSWLHRMPAAPKMLGLIGLSLLAIALDPLISGVLLAAIAVLMAGSVPGAPSKLLDLGQGVLWLSIGLVAFHSLIGQPLVGLGIALRCCSLFVVAMLVTLTTSWQLLIELVEKSFKFLVVLGINTRRVSLCVCLVLRFLPMLMASWQLIQLSWSARSPRRPSWQILSPWCLHAISLADRSEECLDARIPN